MIDATFTNLIFAILTSVFVGVGAQDAVWGLATYCAMFFLMKSE